MHSASGIFYVIDHETVHHMTQSKQTSQFAFQQPENMEKTKKSTLKHDVVQVEYMNDKRGNGNTGNPSERG